MPFLGQLGLGTLILGAFLIGILALMDKFEGFSNFINKFILGNRSDPETLQKQKDLNNNFSSKDSTMTLEEYNKQADALKMTAEDRLGEKTTDQVVMTTSGAVKGVIKSAAVAVDGGFTPPKPNVPLERLPAGSVDPVTGKPTGGQFLPKAVEVPDGKLLSLAKGAGKTVVKTAARATGLVATPVLGYMEYLGNVDDTNMQRAVLNQLNDDGLLKEGDFEKGLEYIKDKEEEDKMIPFWKAVGASMATAAVGAFIVSNPVGWGTGLAMLAAAGTAGSLVGGGISDVAMGDSENKLAEITERDTGLLAYNDQYKQVQEMEGLRLGDLKDGKLAEGFTDPTPETGLTMEDIVSLVNERNLPAGDTNAIADLIKAMGVQGASNITNLATATNTTILANNTGQSSVNDRARFNSGDLQFHNR